MTSSYNPEPAGNTENALSKQQEPKKPSRLKKIGAVVMTTVGFGGIGYTIGVSDSHKLERQAVLHNVCADALEDDDYQTQSSCNRVYDAVSASDDIELAPEDVRLKAQSLQLQADRLNVGVPYAVGGVLLGALMSYSIGAASPQGYSVLKQD